MENVWRKKERIFIYFDVFGWYNCFIFYLSKINKHKLWICLKVMKLKYIIMQNIILYIWLIIIFKFFKYINEYLKPIQKIQYRTHIIAQTKLAIPNVKISNRCNSNQNIGSSLIRRYSSNWSQQNNNIEIQIASRLNKFFSWFFGVFNLWTVQLCDLVAGGSFAVFKVLVIFDLEFRYLRSIKFWKRRFKKQKRRYVGILGFSSSLKYVLILWRIS